MKFEDIFNEYFRDVFHFVLGLSRDRDIAEEVTQDAFVRAMTKLREYDGVKDHRAWLFTIARNAFFDYRRKSGKTVALPDDGDMLRDASASLPEKMVDAETAFAVHRFLHDMPEPYKEVFNLRVFGELPYERIGLIFGKNPGWARVVFFRAKKMITDHLEEWENDK